MKTYMVLALLLLGCQAWATDIPNFPFVFSYGEAEREVAPDLVKIKFNVRCSDVSSETVLERMTTRTAQLTELLSKCKVERKDVVAHSISKREQLRDDGDQQLVNIIGYHVTRDFEITLRDLERYSELMTGLLKTDNVVAIESDFKVSNQEELTDKLLAEAIENAKAKAKKLAAGFGVDIKSVYAISEHQIYEIGDYFRYGFQGTMGAEGQSADLFFKPDTIKVVSAIWTIFRLDVD